MEESPGSPVVPVIPLPGLISRTEQAILFPFHDLHHYSADWGKGHCRTRAGTWPASIDADMGDRPYVLLRLLEGAVPFASMLAEHLKPARK